MKPAQLICSALLGALLFVLSPLDDLQAQTYLPIPSGMCEANQLAYAVDANNLGCTATPVIGANGTAITQVRIYSQTVTPSAVSAAVCEEQAVALTGVTAADNVFLNPPAIATSPGVSPVAARVSAADVLAVTFCNPSGSAASPAAGTFTFTAIRS